MKGTISEQQQRSTVRAKYESSTLKRKVLIVDLDVHQVLQYSDQHTNDVLLFQCLLFSFKTVMALPSF